MDIPSDHRKTNYKQMNKSYILYLILIILILISVSCAPKYYSNYQGKVTKGYNKPPRELKKSKPKYPKLKKKLE